MTDNTKLNIFGTIIILAMLSLFAIFIIYNSEWCKTLMLKGDCGYKLPDNYKLVRSLGTGEYAILLDKDNYLRYTYDDNSITEISLPQYATTFTDSCKAKSFCKKHFEQGLKYKFE